MKNVQPNRKKFHSIHFPKTKATTHNHHTTRICHFQCHTLTHSCEHIKTFTHFVHINVASPNRHCLSVCQSVERMWANCLIERKKSIFPTELITVLAKRNQQKDGLSILVREKSIEWLKLKRRAFRKRVSTFLWLLVLALRAYINAFGNCFFSFQCVCVCVCNAFNLLSPKYIGQQRCNGWLSIHCSP